MFISPNKRIVGNTEYVLTFARGVLKKPHSLIFSEQSDATVSEEKEEGLRGAPKTLVADFLGAGERRGRQARR